MTNFRLKRNFIFGSLAIVLLFFSSINGNTQSQQSLRSSHRSKDNFDFNWQFHKGDIAIKKVLKSGGQGGISDINVEVVTKDTVIDYANSSSYMVFYPIDWKEVNLPHDWVVEGTFINDNNLGNQPAANDYLPTGIGFYRKEFEIPETDKGRKISIEFDGIFRNSTVWVNGHYLGNHKSGYTPSNYDLTDVLRYGSEGKNVILVKVDASEFEGWWYEGGGIYRHVWLVKTDRLHIARFGTFVTTPTISDAQATVSITTSLKNEYKTDKNITLISKIVDKKGLVLDTKTTSQSIDSYDETEIAQTGTINKPLLWSPETPYLYKVLTEVLENGNIIDTY